MRAVGTEQERAQEHLALVCGLKRQQTLKQEKWKILDLTKTPTLCTIMDITVALPFKLGTGSWCGTWAYSPNIWKQR